MQEKVDIKNYCLQELKEIFCANNFIEYQASQVFSWVYAKRVEDFYSMTNISKEMRLAFAEKFYFSKFKIVKKELSNDKTEKFLFELKDKDRIESVFIPEESRATLCVSSQVGCKFNCKFCLSGKPGFKRNLKISEIVNQYLAVSSSVAPSKITNLVFMGIGEPLDNFSNVTKAIEIFMAPSGIGFGKRKICVSTCGLIEGIEKLARLKLGIKLSVSLHSADEAIRTKLMPVNKKYPLKELSKAVKDFTKYEKYPITFEYALIHGINTGKEDARKLIKFVHGINCKINLIPWNKSSLEFNQPDSMETESFCRELKSGGVFFTLRKPRGQDINAACGQLAASWS